MLFHDVESFPTVIHFRLNFLRVIIFVFKLFHFRSITIHLFRLLFFLDCGYCGVRSL